MSCLKQWRVGRRVVGLMSNGVITIADPGNCSSWPDEQCTLATGLSGLIALRDTLTEVIEEVRERRVSKDIKISIR